MSKFENFRIWQGRWPHWRADGQSYYVSFMHKRPLDVQEMTRLFKALQKTFGLNSELIALSTRPNQTEVVFRSKLGREEGFEFTAFLEKAKARAGKDIIAETGERFSLIGGESYDRILRDEVEFADHVQALYDASHEPDAVGSLLFVAHHD